MASTHSIEPPALHGMAHCLTQAGIISETAMRAAMTQAQAAHTPLLIWLVSNGLIDGNQALALAADAFGLPVRNLPLADCTQWPVTLISAKLMRKHQVLPLAKHGKRLQLAMADPTQPDTLADIRFHAGCDIEPVLVEAGQLQQAIASVLQRMTTTVEGLDDALDQQAAVANDADTPATSFDTSTVDDTPVVTFVNTVLHDAIGKGASDIHIEPCASGCRVRVRIDGVLHRQAQAPLALAPRISSRIKVMSGLDIAEKRIPQDGRTQLTLSPDTVIDLRVSTLPTLFGEKIVLRILDAATIRMQLDQLGYTPEQARSYRQAIHRPYGMVLVTGPTGSGKSVSLYTALNMLNTEARNISTVEDPVEIRIEGINQVEQNSKRGLTFANALRAFLRQDPDVIMVGEIRDLETAEIAIKAAQTGHMVLSTLHTNDAPQTITRLLHMGVAPFNIVSAVTMVVAQRLVRCLHDCKQPVTWPPDALLAAGFTRAQIDQHPVIYEAVGCPACTDGYKGRTGIYQIMPMTPALQQIVLRRGNALDLAAAAQTAGMHDLRQAGLRKVCDGITSLAEINRTTNQ